MTQHQKAQLSDEEVICMWMEPEPSPEIMRWSPEAQFLGITRWWKLSHYANFAPQFVPQTLTLDALWDVEERFTGAQQAEYLTNLLCGQDPHSAGFYVAHATAEQKAHAIAAILRGMVAV